MCSTLIGRPLPTATTAAPLNLNRINENRNRTKTHTHTHTTWKKKKNKKNRRRPEAGSRRLAIQVARFWVRHFLRRLRYFFLFFFLFSLLLLDFFSVRAPGGLARPGLLNERHTHTHTKKTRQWIKSLEKHSLNGRLRRFDGRLDGPGRGKRPDDEAVKTSIFTGRSVPQPTAAPSVAVSGQRRTGKKGDLFLFPVR